jgi:hypothetical protein
MQVDSKAVKQACPVPFDEGRLWKGEDGEELKRQLQAHFHNITKAMDCVGCEKCKLWGKLQILGEPLFCALDSPLQMLHAPANMHSVSCHPRQLILSHAIPAKGGLRFM